MGIKNLNKFLREKCPEVFEPTHISNYSFKKVAIDISLYLHKFKAIAGERWLAAFLNLVASLRRNHIHGVFVFDGKSPPEKSDERAKRRKEREKLEKYIYELQEGVEEYHKTGAVPAVLVKLWNRRRYPKRLLGKSRRVDIEWVLEKVRQKRYQLIDIGPEDFQIAKDLFAILKVPCLTAPWEAEKMCAKLCMDGLVDAVLSEDTDVIAYGAPVFLTRIDTSQDTVVAINNMRVREALGISYPQLLDLCIMCGTDYNPNIFRVGAHTAYKKLLKFKHIEGVESNTTLDTSVLKYKRVRELFTEFEDYKIESIPYCGSPDYERLLVFLLKHKVWHDTRRSPEANAHAVESRLEKLKDDFALTVVVFEEDK
jgi:5'-3' exonuclease